MRFLMLSVAAVGLLACAPQVPDSAAGVADPGRGVGFGDYDNYQAQREAQLNGDAPLSVPGPVDVQATPLDADDKQAAELAASNNSGVAPLDASPSNPAPALVSNSDGISGENDFDAVSAQRDIKADAALIAQNRAQYTVIEPTELPKRPGDGGPNIVEYALRTDNPVGTSLYKRSSFRAEAKYARACAAFASADLAQEEFLILGGPQKDRKGMDPDGDGFACDWNPAPFRAARGG